MHSLRHLSETIPISSSGMKQDQKVKPQVAKQNRRAAMSAAEERRQARHYQSTTALVKTLSWMREQGSLELTESARAQYATHRALCTYIPLLLLLFLWDHASIVPEVLLDGPVETYTQAAILLVGLVQQSVQLTVLDCIQSVQLDCTQLHIIMHSVRDMPPG